MVLTSAHNVKKEVETDLMVRAGEWDILSTDELLKSVDKQVFTLIMHEDFEANTVANDVALLILEHSFELTPHINVICLPVQDFNFDGKTCTVTGWGQ